MDGHKPGEKRQRRAPPERVSPGFFLRWTLIAARWSTPIFLIPEVHDLGNRLEHEESTIFFIIDLKHMDDDDRNVILAAPVVR